MKNNENRIWLSTPTMHGEEESYIHNAFETNWVSTVGENIDEFEEVLCNYLNVKNAVALSSGTAAIHTALILANIKSGDNVFCSDLTFAATANPIIYENAVPVFIDSEYETWNMNPEALEQAFKLYPSTKIVLAVHLYGVPFKVDAIREICDKHGAVLIEDAAESLGAKYKGNETGSFGNYNIISFNGNKIITTSGGGMLLTNDDKAADLARKLSTQAREHAPWYQHENVGYNYRMSNLLAGVGRGQMMHLNNHIERKRKIYELYKQGLKKLPIVMNPYIKKDMEPNFWLSCLLIDDENMSKQNRTGMTTSYAHEVGKSCPDEIYDMLARSNIESRPIWKPMHMQPVFNEFPIVSVSDNFVSEDLFRRGLCLPSDIKMSLEEQETVINIIKECFA